jgi:beta-glucosidase
MALQNVEPYLDAILCAWHCGSQTAPVAADILFGDVVPSGKTAVTFVRSSGHIPMYYNTTSSGQPVNGYYGENPERNYLDNSGKPMYPFGFGLSYTEFAYSLIDCAVDTLSVQQLQQGEKFCFRLQVKNIGAVDGKETVQLYIRDRVATLMRPIRELKGFCKMPLRAGEAQQVTFHLGYEDLGFYNTAGEHVVEPGIFEIYIGENCLTRNTTTIRVVQ